MKRVIALILLLLALIPTAQAALAIPPYAPPKGYIYAPVYEGEADYHAYWVPDYAYGDIHHRLGPNCPQTYYDLCEIWKKYGEMYEAGEFNLNVLKEMDYFIFAVNKHETDPIKVEEIVDKYYNRHFKKK